MKKLIPAILSLFITIAAFGQTPTLDSASHGLLINESTLYYVADSFVTDMAGTSGSGVTWDYSQLEGYGNSIADSVVDPSTTAYPTAFSTSYGCDSLEDLYNNYYSFKDFDTLIIDGYVLRTGAGDVVATINIDKQISMIYPFTYMTMFTDTFSGNATLPSVGNATYDGNITVEGDGEGTLLLPNGVTYNDVLRVKSVEDAVANTTGFPPVTVYVLRTKYLYYVAGNKFPVFRHETMDLSGDFTSTITTVFSQDPLLPMSIAENAVEANDVSVFPNPANDVANIRFSLETNTHVNTTVTDLLGNKVKVLTNENLSSGTHDYNLETSALSPGLYFINIKTQGSSVTKKLIVGK